MFSLQKDLLRLKTGLTTTLHRKRQQKPRHFQVLRPKCLKVRNARHQNRQSLTVQVHSQVSRLILWVRHFYACPTCITAFKRRCNKAVHPKWNDPWMHLWSGRDCIDLQSRKDIQMPIMPKSAWNLERYGTSSPQSNNGRTSMKPPA